MILHGAATGGTHSMCHIGAGVLWMIKKQLFQGKGVPLLALNFHLTSRPNWGLGCHFYFLSQVRHTSNHCPALTMSYGQWAKLPFGWVNNNINNISFNFQLYIHCPHRLLVHLTRHLNSSRFQLIQLSFKYPFMGSCWTLFRLNNGCDITVRFTKLSWNVCWHRLAAVLKMMEKACTSETDTLATEVMLMCRDVLWCHIHSWSGINSSCCLSYLWSGLTCSMLLAIG